MAEDGTTVRKREIALKILEAADLADSLKTYPLFTQRLRNMANSINPPVGPDAPNVLSENGNIIAPDFKNKRRG